MPFLNHCRLLVALAAACAAASPAHALPASLQSKPGEYEVTVDSEAMGMPLPTHKHRQCMTQKEMDQGHALATDDIRKRCPDLAVSRQGKILTLSARCTAPAMTIKGEGTSEPEAFSMKFVIDVKEPINMTQRQTITAHRVGDCR